jgi:carboxypeptidase Taq
MRKEISRLAELDREHVLVSHIGAVLGWDQETYMPEAAVEERAEQLALLEGLAHERLTRPEIGDLLGALGSTPQNPMGDSALSPEERAYLRSLRRAYDQATRLPADLVTDLARTVALAQPAWVEARARNDFPAFAPHLERIIALQKRKAACLDPGKPPYDVFLDLYEPGSTEAGIAKVFGDLRAELVALLGKIRSRPQVDASFLSRPCPVERQARMSGWIMDLLAFDRRRGRLDTTAHPFTSTLGGDDIRITTRYLEGNFASSVFSTIHETGHALYEMGMDPSPQFRRTKLSEPTSMAIHESQSRLWENIVGRSEAFWSPNYARLQDLAGDVLAGVPLEAFMKAINRVEPSFIRTEADEVTYSLHVILRFEIEGDLISGRLAVKDVPAAWNAKMEELLGVLPPNDAQGCLQDVHWSCGLFGYFPSYALGNLYAAQLWDRMRETLPDVDTTIRRGDVTSVREWLREKIHRQGSTWLPGELIERATGFPLDARHFVAYLNAKYAKVYGF